MKTNARRCNSTRRDKIKKYFQSLDPCICHLCNRPINTAIPYKTYTRGRWVYNDNALEIDEIIPISRYWLKYDTPEEAALDPDNLRPAHRGCNRARGNKLIEELKKNKKNVQGVEIRTRRW